MDDIAKDKVPYSKVIRSQLILCVLGLLLARWQDNLNSFSGLENILQGLLLASAMMLALLIIEKCLPFLKEAINRDLAKYQSLIGHFGYLQLALIGVLAGVSEEWLFRGFLQSWLVGLFDFEGWTPHLGIILAAICFGALHGLSWVYFLMTFAMGLLFGYVYQASDSLMLVVVWHGFYDVLALCWLKKNNWQL